MSRSCSVRSLLRASAVAAVAVSTLLAQKGAAPAAPKPGVVPRAADGHPDLSGVWSSASRTPFERPAIFKDKPTLTDAEAKEWETGENARWAEGYNGPRPIETIQGGAYNVLFYDNGKELARIGGKKRTSVVVDPPDGHVPQILPAARARLQRPQNVAGDYRNLSNDTRCLVGNTPAVPLVPAAYNNNYEIVQSADSVLIELEMVHEARVVRINAKHEPPNVRKWTGDSIGHWEGDTLVVETTNLTDKTHYRGSSQNMKVTERFTRVSDRSIEYRATMDDPSTWAAPWTIEEQLTLMNDPILEYACHEGNYAMAGILGDKNK